MPRPNLDKPSARPRSAAKHAKLPEVEASTSYGRPALKARGKSIAGAREVDVLVLMRPIEEKEILIEALPEIYFETDHYKGWPAVLVRLSKVPAADLRHRLRRAWPMQAPKRLIAALEDKWPPPWPSWDLRMTVRRKGAQWATCLDAEFFWGAWPAPTASGERS